jgi:hypothetical protein
VRDHRQHLLDGVREETIAGHHVQLEWSARPRGSRLHVAAQRDLCSR